MITKATSRHPVPPLLSLFVACYNEADNIGDTLTNVRDACEKAGIRYEVLVIDDASRDHSVEIIQTWMKENPQVPLQLTVNPRNLGLASNFITAARQATGEWYRLICGDNVEPMETLATIFQEVGKRRSSSPLPHPVPGQDLEPQIDFNFIHVARQPLEWVLGPLLQRTSGHATTLRRDLLPP